MTVGLFVPCYVDQFYPDVAIATLNLLEKLGCQVSYPLNQTCCGQPMANSGFASMTTGCNINFMEQFANVDYIVAPSGSCVLHIKEHLHDHNRPELAQSMREKVYELSEFITDVLKIQSLKARFPHRVGYHNSCHGQRMLHLSSMTETMTPAFSKPGQLLQMVEGLELIQPQRADECCGFGGTFCVTEEALSSAMGEDRVDEHEANKVEYITGGDMSCLMHLEGVLKRKKSNVRIIHLAQILNAE